MMNLKRNFSLICLSVVSIGILSSCGNKNDKISYEFTYYDGHSVNVDVPKGKDVKQYYPANTPKHDDGYHEYTYTWNFDTGTKYKEKQNDTKISSLYTFTYYDKHTQQVDVPRGGRVEEYFPSNTSKHDDGFKEYTYSWEKSQSLNYIEKQSYTKISKDYLFDYADGREVTVEVPKNGKVEDYFPKEHSDSIYDEPNQKLYYYYTWALDHDNVYTEVSIDIDIYKVTYVMPDGAKNPSDNPTLVYYGTQHTLSDASCTGYTFEGWYSDPEFQNKITEIYHTTDNLTIYGKFTPITYTITYNLNGGTNNPDNPATYIITDNEIELKDSIKEDCSFGGWYLDPNYINKVTKINCKNAKNISLYAKFAPTVYTITYYLDGGINPKTNPDTYTFYDEITFASPTKNGYTFDGWFEDYTFDTPITGLKNSKGNKNLYAKYTRNVYTITYHTDGGSAPILNPTSYTIDDTINLVDSEKIGYTFKGWFEDETFKKQISTISNRYENLNLYAKFSANTYKATFHIENVNSIKAIYNYYSSKEDLKSSKLTTECRLYNPTSFNPYEFAAEKELYGFVDWEIINRINQDNELCVTLNSNQIDTGITESYSPKEEFNLSATSSGKGYTDTKTKTLFIPGYYDNLSFKYDLNVESTGFAELNITSSGTSIFYRRIVKSGISYDFTISGLDKGSELYFYVGALTDEDFLFSHSNLRSNKSCTIKSYDYLLKDLEVTFEYDSYVNVPVVERNGYNFVNWKDADGNEFKSGTWKLLKNIDLYPTWSTIEYDIDYHLNGGINNPDNPSTYNIETNSFSLKDPSREGYTFKGWYEDETFTKQISGIDKGTFGKKNLYAKWSNTVYTLTLNPNGGTIKPKVNFYDDTALLETQIVGSTDKVNYLIPNDKQGLIFTGWYEDKACTILHDFSKTITNSINLYAGWFEYQGSYEPVVNPVKVSDTVNNVEINGIDKENIFAFSPLTNTSITISSDGSDKTLYSVAKLYEYIDGTPSLVCESSYKSESDLNFTLTYNVKAGHVYYLIVNGKYTTSIGTISVLFNGTYLPETSYGTTYTDSTSYNVTYDKDYLLMDVTKDGSTFIGWFDENDNEYTEGTWKTADNVTLFAKWN